MRSRYWAESVTDATISRQTHLALAQRVLRYHDAIHEFRSEVDKMPDIEPLLSRAGEKTEIIHETKRRGSGTTTEKVPAVLDIPPEQLVRMSKELDDTAHQLDFTDEPAP